MQSKKGETSIGVTIAIILGIAIIVFLIWGFSTQWSIFSSTGGGFAGKSNVDALRNACKLQCDNQQEVEFCTVKKNVIDKDGKSSQATCREAPLNATVSCPGLC